jgi:hypothetical protein
MGRRICVLHPIPRAGSGRAEQLRYAVVACGKSLNRGIEVEPCDPQPMDLPPLDDIEYVLREERSVAWASVDT